mmetsp:Transcript_26652/g.63927  ORF Transcript_26652/g.63927 Transcript_26652/m.63927 type:complete len:244 (+) Transcript_26652:1247-1978(+)
MFRFSSLLGETSPLSFFVVSPGVGVAFDCRLIERLPISSMALLLRLSSSNPSQAFSKSNPTKSLLFNNKYTSPTLVHLRLPQLIHVASFGEDQFSLGMQPPPPNLVNAESIRSVRFGKLYFSSFSLLPSSMSSSSSSEELPQPSSTPSSASFMQDDTLAAHSGSRTPSLNKYSMKFEGSGRITTDSMVTFFRAFLLVVLFRMVETSMPRNSEYHDENWHAWTSRYVGLGRALPSESRICFFSC